jgi:hypothetical protein
MTSNGNLLYTQNVEDHADLLLGVKSTATAIPALSKAADALLEAARALRAMGRGIEHVGDQTSRALSDSVELKRHLSAITDREQVLRAEVDSLKAQWRRKTRVVGRTKRAGPRARKHRRGK